MRSLKYQIKTALTVASLMGLTAILVSCGSSDPMKGYNLKGVPAHSQKSEIQSVCAADPISLQLLPESTTEFIRQRTGQIKIRASSITNTPVDVRIGEDFPYVNELNKTAGPNNTVIFSWTPGLRTVAPNSQGKSFSFPIIATTKFKDCPFEKSLTTKLLVSVTDKQDPIKVKNINLPGKLTEGKFIDFSIEVTDATFAKNDASKPEVQIIPKYYSNTEAFTAEPIIQTDITKIPEPTFDKNGLAHFTFNKKLDLTTLPVTRDRVGNIDRNAKFVKICFNVKAQNYGFSSGEKSICAEASYTAQPPVLTWANDQDSSAVVGSEKSFAFTLTTNNDLFLFDKETVSKDLSQQAQKSLAGTSQVFCQDSQKGSQALDCVLTWTPSCKKLNGNKIDFKTKTIINNTEKLNASKPKVFTVTDDNGTCQQPASKSKQAQAQTGDHK